MVTTRLGVNLDHVATLRQIRQGRDPEPVAAALLAQGAGAHSIGIHLRGDRRHVQERDARLLREVLSIPLNVECAASPEAIESVIPVKPAWVTLVPETREELASPGGLDVVFLQVHLRQLVRELRTSDIAVSLFIDPNLEQVKMASRLEVDAIELSTSAYASLPNGADTAQELERLREASKLSARLGMRTLAGRGLDRSNVAPVAALPDIEALQIGHSLVARAMLVGMEKSVQEMLALLREVRP